jgi:diguanylate cyclase (GGDEF)-like protein/PAS domain S-box-containing protein
MNRVVGRPWDRSRLLVGLVALGTVAWVVLLLSRASDHDAQLVSNVGLVLSPLTAGVAALYRFRRSLDPGRRFWALTGAAALSWGSGQAVWTWYESFLGRQVPLPSLADVGYLGMPLLAAAALISLPLAAPTVAGRVRTILDGLMIAVSLLVCSWVLVLKVIVGAGTHSEVLGQVISLGYPVGDVVLITIVTYTALQLRQARTPLPFSLPLVGVGLVGFAIADTGFAYLTTIGAYRSGNGIDVGWFVGYALIAVAALRHPPQPRSPVGDQEVGNPVGALLPSAAVMLALLTSVVDIVRTGHTGMFESWARTIILLLLVARQILTLRENRYLTQYLEHRVRERTVELAASRERFAALVQHSSDVVTVAGTDGVISYQSMSSNRVFGYHPDQLEGTSLCGLMGAREGTELLEALAHAAAKPLRVHALRSTWTHATDGPRDVELTITNLLDHPHVNGLVINSRDITDRTNLEAELLHQAFHDPLTGLANRALFRDRLGHALARRRAGDGLVAILFLDLDGFKEINDTVGHSSGDELLVLVARRLVDQVRAGDTVARFGGDEFAILVDTSRDAAAEAPLLADRIGTALQQPFTLGSQQVHVSASIGIAASDGTSASSSEQLLRNADLAMYRAKARASGFAVYDPAMHATLVERVQTETDLRYALDHGQFVVHYQPLVTLRTGRIGGSEALVRWEHPERGLVLPGHFISLMESTGLIRPLGLWVLRQACEKTAAWQRSAPGLRDLNISVNVSARQIPGGSLFEEVRATLQETGLAPTCLTLEMTESILLEDDPEVRELLERFRAYGVRLAIDDFGTGYSSLSYLHRFPVDVLKIDRSFIRRLGNGDDGALVSTIVRLGQTMNLETVAEGIEHAEEMLMLLRQGCTTGQGFYFSPALPADDLAALLHEQCRLGDVTEEPLTV